MFFLICLFIDQVESNDLWSDFLHLILLIRNYYFYWKLTNDRYWVETFFLLNLIWRIWFSSDIYYRVYLFFFFLIDYAFNRFDLKKKLKNRISVHNFLRMINIEEIDFRVCHSNFEMMISISHYSVSIILYFVIQYSPIDSCVI